ncbi:hypothetical protein DHCNIT_0001140 [Dehalococcoides mccartyi]|nr:hypothetical protein DHCNIT_0001140 [Dehalococcoides mccartyi]
MHTPENGIKILARMIAEAYIEELSQKPHQNDELKEVKEDDNANQRCDRSGEASPPGESKAGSKKRKC